MQREDEKTIVLKAYNTGRITAFQMGFRFLPSELSINSIEKGDLNTQNDVFDFNKEDNGKLRTLWYDRRGKDRIIKDGTVLLKARINANANIDDILNILNLDDNILKNEFYDASGNLTNVSLYWEIEKSKDKKTLEVNVFPNPFNNNLAFDIHSSISDKAIITISSIVTGQNMIIERELTQGLNTITIDNAASLPEGMLTYTIQCSGYQIASGHFTKFK